VTDATPSLFADLPYGLHVLPSGDGRFVVFLGRDDDMPAAKVTVEASRLREVALMVDGLFASNYRMDRVIATQNYLTVYGSRARHHATTKAWAWLEDQREISDEKRKHIASVLRDLDDDLRKLDAGEE
jgi:hypothetical protein